MAKPEIVRGVFTGTVAEDDAAQAAATGNIEYVDDDGAVTYTARSSAGKFGTFVIDETTGAWRYDLSNEAAQPLDDDGQPSNPTEVFTVRVIGSGGSKDFVDTEIKVTVNGANDAPSAADDVFAASEDRPLVVSGNGVIGNDSDVDGDLLSATLVKGPANGTLELNSNGSFTYTPKADFSGSDSFTYRASDGDEESAIATVAIDIVEVSDVPVVGSETATVSEDEKGSVGGTLAIVDGDKDDSVTVSATGAKYGTFAIDDDGKWTYDLDETAAVVQALPTGGTLVDAITVSAQDESGLTGTGKVSITIEGANDNPVAADDTAVANEDAPVSILPLANDSDPDTGDKIRVSAVELVGGKGTVQTDGTRITFDPSGAFEDLALGETAPVVVNYTITDDNGGTATANVDITVEGRNDLPAAAADNAETAEDTPVTIDVLANDTDIDEDALSIASVGSAKNGTVEIVDNEIVFTPTANFNGQTSFTYVASDGTGKSTAATVTVDVTPVNDAPVTVADKGTTEQGKGVTVAVLANDTDVDKDALTVTKVEVDKSLGEVVIVDGTAVAFTPAADLNKLGAGQSQTVTIGYTASDDDLSSPGTLDIVVKGLNDAPTATDDEAETTAESAVTFDVLPNDTDPDRDDLLSLSSAKVTSGLGKVTVQGGQLVYSPGTSYVGLGEADEPETVVISYNIADGKGGKATANAVVTVTGINDAPVAAADKATTDQDTVIGIAALTNDKDPDTNDTLKISAAIPTSGLGGIVTSDDTMVIFDPGTDFDSLGAKQSSAVTIDYTIEDSEGASSTSTIQLKVTGVNDTPVAEDDPDNNTTENAKVSIAVTANDTDVDASDKLSVKSVQLLDGAGGTAKASGGSITFDPGKAFDALAAGEETEVKLSYLVSDSGKATDEGAVTITVTGENDAPKAAADTATTEEDKAVSIAVLANDIDIDNDQLVVASSGSEKGGTVSVDDSGNVLFTPTANFNGKGGFTYEISDGQGGTSSASVSLTVTAVNDAPIAKDAAFLVDEDGKVTLNLLSGATDVDAGDKLKMDSVDTEGTLGTVTLTKNGVVYVADSSVFDQLADGATATDTFKYTVADKAGEASEATVTMTVNGIADTEQFVGTDGSDNFKGTPGEDFVSGFGGNDVLAGADGDDTIAGGNDDDRLTGGGGRDRFALGPGSDIITDFVSGRGGDILDVTIFSTTASDLDDFLGFVRVGANTEIFIDFEGGGNPILSPDAQTTVQGVDLVGGAGSQDAVIAKLVADGNLVFE